MFTNRTHAGKLLAQKLTKYQNKKNVVVLGIPRGGVIVAYEVARALKLPLDVLIIKKISAPGDEEFALGAASMNEYYINEDLAFDVPKDVLDVQIKQKQQESKERYTFLKGKKRPHSLRGKIVIVVDDGIATGATMRLAVILLKRQGVKQIVIATPVAPPSAIQALLHEADEVVALEQPKSFMAIGAHYKNFTQVEVEEVKELLQ